MLRRLTALALFGLIAAPVTAQDVLPVSTALNAPSMINELHQREWVRLDDEGVIHGKLMVLNSAGREARVGAGIVISRDGQVIQKTKSDFGGVFQLEGLEPGTYALQVTGDVTYAAYALHVLPAAAEHLASDLEVYASVLPAERARELVNENLTPNWDVAAGDVYYRDHQSDPIAAQRKFNNSHQIALRDGDLVGRVSRPGWDYADQDLTGTIAQLVREGDVVAKVGIQKDGFFQVEDVEPGIYDLFVSGDDGFAAIAFEAVAPAQSVASTDGKITFVSTQVGMSSDCLCCELIQQPEIICCETVVEVVETCTTCEMDPCGCADPCAPLPGGGLVGGGGFYGGGYGGGFGGGGGGYGGGVGGIGGLAGAAGLAVGVAALADDDDGFNQNVATIIAP